MSPDDEDGPTRKDKPVTEDDALHQINLMWGRAAWAAKAAYADWVAKQCRRIADQRPWSTEAETLLRVAGFAARDAERFREAAIGWELEEELRVTDLDELTARLTQN